MYNDQLFYESVIGCRFVFICMLYQDVFDVKGVVELSSNLGEVYYFLVCGELSWIYLSQKLFYNWYCCILSIEDFCFLGLQLFDNLFLVKKDKSFIFVEIYV